MPHPAGVEVGLKEVLLARVPSRQCLLRNASFVSDDKNDKDDVGLLGNSKVTEQSAVAQTFKHPPGLWVLCGTMAFQAFSYYGCISMFMFFMTNVIFSRTRHEDVRGMWFVAALFGYPNASLPEAQRYNQVKGISAQMYGIFDAWVHFTPLAGGYLADRHFGQYPLVAAGSVVMALGFSMLAFEALALVALLVIIVGNGIVGPSIYTMVGHLYDNEDPVHRDTAFSLLYCSINVGAALGPIAVGSLQAVFSYRAAFFCCGASMLCSLLVVSCFYWTLPPDAVYLEDHNEPSTEMEKGGLLEGSEDAVGDKAPAESDGAARADGASAGAEEGCDPRSQLQARPAVIPLLRANSRRVIAIILLAAQNILFWGAYEQMYSTLALFIDENVVKHNIPSAYFMSVNPCLILALTPVINALWRDQARRGTEPHQVTKMAIGCLLLGAGHGVLALGAVGGGKISALWVFCMLLMQTLGELYLSPVGLSFVTQVSPPELTGLLMGTWTLSYFFGSNLAGWLGKFYSSMFPSHFWALCGSLVAGNGVLMLVTAGALKSELTPLGNAYAGPDM